MPFGNVLVFSFLKFEFWCGEPILISGINTAMAICAKLNMFRGLLPIARAAIHHCCFQWFFFQWPSEVSRRRVTPGHAIRDHGPKYQ